MKTITSFLLAFLSAISMASPSSQPSTVEDESSDEIVAVRECSGEEVLWAKETINCPYRNRVVLGNLHRGNCMLVRLYAKTICRDADGNEIDSDEYHLCAIMHRSVHEVNLITRSVCSTCIDTPYYGASTGDLLDEDFYYSAYRLTGMPRDNPE